MLWYTTLKFDGELILFSVGFAAKRSERKVVRVPNTQVEYVEQKEGSIGTIGATSFLLECR